MAHPAAGLLACTRGNHLIIAPQRAVEEEQVGAIDPSPYSGRKAGAARNVVEGLSARRNLKPDRAFGRSRQIASCLLFEIKRHLAGHGKSQHPNSELPF